MDKKTVVDLLVNKKSLNYIEKNHPELSENKQFWRCLNKHMVYILDNMDENNEEYNKLDVKGLKKLYKKLYEYENKEHEWYTLDNGGIPYMVKIKGRNIKIYQNKYLTQDYNEYDEDMEPVYDKLIKEITKFEHVYINKDQNEENYNEESKKFKSKCKQCNTHFKGKITNLDLEPAVAPSVLIQISPLKYLYVGDSIFEINPKEPITYFYTEINNSGVVYSYIKTSKNICFITENKCIPNDRWEILNEPFQIFYAYEEKVDKSKKEDPKLARLNKMKFDVLKTKTIQKRI